MVNQAEQPESIDAPLPETGNTTTDITSEFEGANTFEDTPTPTEETTDTPPPPENVETPTETTEKPAEAPPETLEIANKPVRIFPSNLRSVVSKALCAITVIY